MFILCPIKYGCIRDPQGQLTSYKSGDRYVYVRAFSPPLPRQQKIGMFHCMLIHHGKEPCLDCGEVGHSVGDSCCKAAPTQSILAFKGYTHPLSNHFPCKLRVYEKEFNSLEQAYLYYMAREFGKHDLAAGIQDCKHAGEAKRMSKDISEDDMRWEWEKNNTDVMKNLLLVKAQQCARSVNVSSRIRTSCWLKLLLANYGLVAGSPYVTENCSPSFWPGQNMLGALLTDLTQALLTDSIGDEGNAYATTPLESQCTIAEEVDKDTTVTDMEAEGLNDEHVHYLYTGCNYPRH